MSKAKTARAPYFDTTPLQLAAALRAAGVKVLRIDLDDEDEGVDPAVVLDAKYELQVSPGVVSLNWWVDENTDDAMLISLPYYNLPDLLVAIANPTLALAQVEAAARSK